MATLKMTRGKVAAVAVAPLKSKLLSFYARREKLYSEKKHARPIRFSHVLKNTVSNSFPLSTDSASYSF